jgi:hypothetical protein
LLLFFKKEDSSCFSEKKKQKTFMSYAASLWVAVWLAVAVQVGAGAVAQAEADPALAAATIFCHGGQDHGQHHAPLHRHLVDQGILRSSVGALQALAVLESAPCLPAPSFARTGRAEPMQARAPPARSLRAFDARGPPIPV